MFVELRRARLLLPSAGLPSSQAPERSESNEGDSPNGPIVRALCCQISVWNHQLRSLTCRTSQIRPVCCVSDLAASLDRSWFDRGLDRASRDPAVLDPRS
jgi:hypothetical protein